MKTHKNALFLNSFTVILYTEMQSIKTQVLGIRCRIKQVFLPIMDFGFNAASKIRNMGLNWV